MSSERTAEHGNDEYRVIANQIGETLKIDVIKISSDEGEETTLQTLSIPVMLGLGLIDAIKDELVG